MDTDQLVRGGSGTPRSADRHATRVSRFDNAVLSAAAACGRRFLALSRAVRTMGESPFDHRLAVSGRSNRRAKLSLSRYDAFRNRGRHAGRADVSVAISIADAARVGPVGPRDAFARRIVDVRIRRGRSLEHYRDWFLSMAQVSYRTVSS